MALIRWGQENDFSTEFDRMQREMNRLMSLFTPTAGQDPFWRRRGYRTTVYPPVNVYEDGEGFIVRAEVPGVDPNSLDIEVAGDTLTIRGERKVPELPSGASYHRRERDFGQFRRSLTLPDRVDTTKVMAKAEHGILEIRLPHAEEAKSRKITVKNA